MSKQYVMKNGTTVEVSDEVYEILRKSDRRIKYVERDLKETKHIINKEKATVKEIPAREDSLDRLTALDGEELKYGRNDEDMSVQLSFNSDDFDIILVFKVFPERDLITLFSPLTFTAPEDGRQDIAMAMTVLNDVTYDGMWTINISNGDMEFRMTNSYCDSIVGKNCYKDMMSMAITANHKFAAKFFMIGKSAMSFEQFMDELFGDE